ncbi:hypothetical protein Syun_022460 [Stephania yunnanensis]|uniref:C2H2-type domain-containing protein n=1 Tax=Stephania yunnanensis TaxID=152371 RepID=A0AAP0FKM9_9MAGN
MATNRFICEVCNKGFQREQNLQLHRRGHNLPWKLKQKTTKEVKRRVYLCPEPTCVHHDPSRALGDLTGIKKHFCRKHGEKKWKCDKCSKRYAVQSDWKAHSKTCGTREYRCDCGTLFSRRDSFITHRAFCDALAQESARLPTALTSIGSHLYGSSSGMGLGLSQVGSQISTLQDHPSSDFLRLGGSGGATQFDHLIPQSAPPFRPPQPTSSSAFFLPNSNHDFHEDTQHGLLYNNSASTNAAAANIFNLGFFPNSNTSTSSMNNNNSNTTTTNNNNNNNNTNNNSHISSSALLNIADQFNANPNAVGGDQGATIFSGNIIGHHHHHHQHQHHDHMSSNVPSLFNAHATVQNENVSPQMSATALLQKAAQMGSTTSSGTGASLLMRGFGSTTSTNNARASDNVRANIDSSNFRGGFGGGGGGEGINRPHIENENHLQDLMNSLANGSSPIFGDQPSFSGFNPNRVSLEQQHSSSSNMCEMDEAKLHHQNLTVSIGGSDRLTRDFLGVGGVIRSMGGGMSAQRDHHHQQQQQQQRAHGIDISSLDSEMKSAAAAAANRPFGGGNLQ